MLSITTEHSSRGQKTVSASRTIHFVTDIDKSWKASTLHFSVSLTVAAWTIYDITELAYQKGLSFCRSLGYFSAEVKSNVYVKLKLLRKIRPEQNFESLPFCVILLIFVQSRRSSILNILLRCHLDLTI